MSTPAITPPVATEAEREVLSALLVASPETMAGLLESMSAELFFVARHRLIFAALAGLHQRGSSVDPVTLAQQLKDLGDYDRVGGARAIGELLDRQGSVANARHYLAILAEKARLRRLIDHAHRIETACHQDVDDVSALVERVTSDWSQTLDAIRPDTPQLQLSTIGEIQHRDQVSWLSAPPPEAASLLLEGGARPFLRDGRVGLLVAPGGTGKSFALVQLAVAVATGGRWLGTYQCARKGRVLLACGEEDLDEVRRRIYAVTRDLSEYEQAEVVRHVVPLGLAGCKTAFLERSDGQLATTPWHSQFLAAISQHHWRLIILDPLSRWGGPEVETDAHAATELVTLLEALAQAPGAPAVICAHHERKAAQGGGLSDASSVRGSSALVDGPRWIANLRRRRKGGLLELVVSKSNLTVPPPPLILSRQRGGMLVPASHAEIAQAELEET